MKTEPHIIYIITKLELGGAQKICLSLFLGLRDQGFATSLISSSQGYFAATLENKKSVYLLPELTREVSAFRFISEFKAFIILTKKLRELKKQYPQIICHTHSTKAGLFGRWAAFFAGIKYRVHTIHGYAFHEHQNNLKWFIIYLLELVTSFITTKFICVSQKDAQTGIKLFPAFRRKYSIIRAAINWDQFYIPDYTPINFPVINRAFQGSTSKVAAQAESHGNFIFGTISCFKPQKNLLDLLKAFAVVYYKNPHTRLEILGDGEQRKLLENWIVSHNLTHVIKLHGWQDNILPILKTWHAFTLSSLWEGLPCSIIEARMLKIPVISYNTGGISDVVFHEQNGLLYTPKDWPSLSTGMLKLSTDPGLFAKLQAYSDNLEEFKDSSMLEAHSKLYKLLQKSVVSRKPTTPIRSSCPTPPKAS